MLYSLWLSNLLYLHSSNQPFILGSFPSSPSLSQLVMSSTVLTSSFPTAPDQPTPTPSPIPASPLPNSVDILTDSTDIIVIINPTNSTDIIACPIPPNSAGIIPHPTSVIVSNRQCEVI